MLCHNRLADFAPWKTKVAQSFGVIDGACPFVEGTGGCGTATRRIARGLRFSSAEDLRGADHGP